jgi:hypothetical protein
VVRIHVGEPFLKLVFEVLTLLHLQSSKVSEFGTLVKVMSSCPPSNSVTDDEFQKLPRRIEPKVPG